MECRELELLDLNFYHEKLDNGLNIFLLPLKGINNYCINYCTCYGSDILQFNNTKLNPGTAHFLEHKVFEQEEGEKVFEFYEKHGSYANAYTNHDSTCYVVEGNNYFKEDLSFLIDYVNKPYFTDENINKEKGIIKEEINSNIDNPFMIMNREITKCIFKNSNRIYDIAGEVSDIEKIDRNTLKKVYDTFYIPNNMFISIVGCFDKDEAINIIKTKKYNENMEFNIIKKEETEEVNKKNKTIYNSNIEIDRLSVALKINLNNYKEDKYIVYKSIEILSDILFGECSILREDINDNNLVNSLGYYEYISDNYLILQIESKTKNIDTILNKIIYTFNNYKNYIDEDSFNRIKKVYKSNIISLSNNCEQISNYIIDTYITYKNVYYNLEELDKIDYKLFKKIINKIDFDNYCYIKMLSNK